MERNDASRKGLKSDEERFTYIFNIHPPCDLALQSKSFQVSSDIWFKINEAQLIFFNTMPGAKERRMRDMCDVPFEL
ncbi:hypothetical protein Cflav_PD2091 [Pedosphaera parvula Ellin514]|uniref:Uncharacterized protein n=1 Tax=Pedosphaera parvula (strain Ellin514) TaxID=320771 RepID=B9XLJ2_PEDPL|nr:hypothetical protein Cflav_PD2091 [Pedosphaera parvula Ellin514]